MTLTISPRLAVDTKRTRTRRGGRLAIWALLATLLGACATTPVQVAGDARWIEVRSEHFTLTSAVSPEETRALAHELELFRAAVLRMTTISEIPAHHPTHVYVFDDTRRYRAFSSGSLSAGYMVSSLRANLMSIDTRSSMDSRVALKHEYTHWLVHTITSINYPMWLDEGFAEFMSTAAVEDELVWIGLVPEARIPNLRYSRWIDLRDVLEADGYDDWLPERKSMFYAEAWAWVHYLFGDAERREAFETASGTYIGAIESGASVPDAFATAFGYSVDEGDERLRAYLRAGRFPKFATGQEKIVWSKQVSARVLDESEAATRLGTLSLTLGDVDAARALYERACLLDPRSARAQAGLGDALKFAGDFAGARPYFERAVELDPDEPLNQIDLGEFWLDWARRTDDPAERVTMLKRARRAFVRAHGLDDRQAETYAMYGATFLMPGEDAGKGIESLEEARRLLPGSSEVRMLLAEAYLRTDRRTEAVGLVRSALAGQGRGYLSDASRAMLEGLETGRIDSVLKFPTDAASEAEDPSETLGARPGSRSPSHWAPETKTARSARRPIAPSMSGAPESPSEPAPDRP